MKTKNTIVVLLSIYAVCVILVCLFWENSALLTGCYFVISILLFIRYHTKSDVIFYFIAFVLGPLGEFIAILFGAWSYAKPFYFIPTWLPFVWGIAVLLVKKLSENILTNDRTYNSKG
jgi:hypothetical protein